VRLVAARSIRSTPRFSGVLTDQLPSQPFQRLTVRRRQVTCVKPLKRLGFRARFATWLKPGVNEIIQNFIMQHTKHGF
jgi:hypothetical protein